MMDYNISMDIKQTVGKIRWILNRSHRFESEFPVEKLATLFDLTIQDVEDIRDEVFMPEQEEVCPVPIMETYFKRADAVRTISGTDALLEIDAENSMMEKEEEDDLGTGSYCTLGRSGCNIDA